MLPAPAATSNARRRRWVQGRLPPVLPRLGRSPTASTGRAPPRRTFCLWPLARPDEGSCPPVLSAERASFELDPWPQAQLLVCRIAPQLLAGTPEVGAADRPRLQRISFTETSHRVACPES